MQINRLKLSNFRNHKKIEISFSHTNLLLGPNGSGKTSILEALYLLSTSKSPRTVKTKDLIKLGMDKAFLELDLAHKNKTTKTIRLLMHRENYVKNKTFSIDGVKVEPKDIVGQFRTVYFSPETLEIINGGPSERRRFIDILISQIDPLYLRDLIEYKKILTNRNRLLKLISSRKREREEITFWDERLIEFGSRIIRERKKVIDEISPCLNQHHQNIIGLKKNKVGAIYHPSFVFDKGHDEVETVFTERLSKDFDFEIKYGTTIYGPHRDDIKFNYNGHDASSFCSRGEIRSIVVALIMAEAVFIHQKTDDFPLILLDDIYSELDSKRAQALSKLILGRFQTIISSTEEGVVHNFIKTKISLILLTGGKQKKTAHV